MCPSSGTAHLLCHLTYGVTKEAAPIALKATRSLITHPYEDEGRCDHCVSRKMPDGFATMEKLFRSAI